MTVFQCSYVSSYMAEDEYSMTQLFSYNASYVNNLYDPGRRKNWYYHHRYFYLKTVFAEYPA